MTKLPRIIDIEYNASDIELLKYYSYIK